jgi:hypothetical protein
LKVPPAVNQFTKTLDKNLGKFSIPVTGNLTKFDAKNHRCIDIDIVVH